MEIKRTEKECKTIFMKLKNFKTKKNESEDEKREPLLLKKKKITNSIYRNEWAQF